MKILRLLCMCVLTAVVSAAGAQNVNEVVDSVKAGLKASSVKEAVEKVKDAFEAKVAAADSLVGTWEYREPAVMSTSGNLLRKAAGNALAGQLEKMMDTYTQKSGITPENTTISFRKNGTFTRNAVRRKASGTWMVNGERLMLAQNNVQTADLTTRLENGELMLLADVKRMLEIYKALGGVPDNMAVKAIEKMSKVATGLKCGFLFVKKQ